MILCYTTMYIVLIILVHVYSSFLFNAIVIHHSPERIMYIFSPTLKPTDKRAISKMETLRVLWLIAVAINSTLSKSIMKLLPTKDHRGQLQAILRTINRIDCTELLEQSAGKIQADNNGN